jgi:hypothetical protein
MPFPTSYSVPTGVPANTNVPVLSPASAAEVTAVLGEVDPMIVARVLATNATVDEIEEAIHRADDYSELAFLPASSPRVAEVRAILDDADAFGSDLFEDEYAMRDDNDGY